jgi:hypothetical protein
MEISKAASTADVVSKAVKGEPSSSQKSEKSNK